MASDPDSCIPDALKDFVFDLHDSVRTSQIASEQAVLYSGTFRELTAKYFAQGPWPSPQSIASECPNDPLFLALYRELTLRHHHSISRPTVRDRVEGWHAYRTLFDLLIAESTNTEKDATDDAMNGGRGPPVPDADPLYLLPEWTFDLLHEFVYQFQGFCQYRTAAFANAAKYTNPNSDGNANDDVNNNNNGGTNDKDNDGNNNDSKMKKSSSAPHHVTESIDVLSQNRDAWAVETVLFYLHRLVGIATNTADTNTTSETPVKPSAPAFQHLSVFASVTLSRLECLLGDYTASLSALTPLHGILFTPTTIGSTTPSPSTPTNAQLVRLVFAARLSVSYHAGVSYLMLRRYKDATLVLGDICAILQRGFKSGRVSGVIGGEGRVEQYSKQYDRMIALLAILTHACPGGNGRVASGGGATGSVGGNGGGGGALVVEDSVARVVGDRHRTQLSKIEAGEEGYEDLFIFACPKFISPAVPDYASLRTGGVTPVGVVMGGQDAYKLQVRHFMNEMASQQTMRKLRSYMKLYTSIGVEKLGRLVLEAEFESLLLSYKHKMRQIEVDGRGVGGGEDGVEVTSSSSSPLDGKVGTVMDIHYYIKDDVIHVDEAEKQNRFENYFVSQISQCNDIIKDVEAISVNI